MSLISKLLDHVDQKAQQAEEQSKHTWIELVIHVAEERTGLSPDAILDAVAKCGKSADQLRDDVEKYSSRRGLVEEIERLRENIPSHKDLRQKCDSLVKTRDETRKKHDAAIAEIEGQITQLHNRQRSINENLESLRSTCGGSILTAFRDAQQRLSFLENQRQTESYHLEHPTPNTPGNPARLAELDRQIAECKAALTKVEERVKDPAAFLR